MSNRADPSPSMKTSSCQASLKSMKTWHQDMGLSSAKPPFLILSLDGSCNCPPLKTYFSLVKRFTDPFHVCHQMRASLSLCEGISSSLLARSLKLFKPIEFLLSTSPWTTIVDDICIPCFLPIYCRMPPRVCLQGYCGMRIFGGLEYNSNRHCLCQSLMGL